MNGILVGDRVPDFTVKDLDGNTIQMSDYVGKKTLLVFFRFASCPLWAVGFAQLIQNYPEDSKKGLNIIAVFESSPEYIRRYVNDKRKVSFPVIANLEGNLYNVKKPMMGTMKSIFRIFKMFKSMMDSAFSMGKPVENAI